MSPPSLLAAGAGLVGWSVAFAGIYALHGLGCARGWDVLAAGPFNLQRAVLVAAWALCLLLLAGLAAWAQRRRPRGDGDPARALIRRLTAASAWAGLAATVVTLLPVATYSLCL